MSDIDEIKSRPKAGLKFGPEKNQRRDGRTRNHHFFDVMTLGESCHCGLIHWEVDESAVVDVVCGCKACKMVPPNDSES
jgi:hypothetical protein